MNGIMGNITFNVHKIAFSLCNTSTLIVVLLLLLIVVKIPGNPEENREIHLWKFYMDVIPIVVAVSCMLSDCLVSKEAFTIILLRNILIVF